MYAIGLDIGTTSVSAMLMDAQTGAIVQNISCPNDSGIATDRPWEKLQDPQRLLSILQKALDRLMEAQLPVVSIGVTGQMHGVVYLDQDANPVSPLITWQDGRGDLEYRDNKTYAEYMRGQTGCSLATGYGAVTLFYDTVNCLVPKDAVTFCTIQDLVAMKLAGRKQPLVHVSDAASFGLFDPVRGEFRRDEAEKLGLQVSLFPPVCRGYQVLGSYQGIPVSAAIGDNQASFLGSVSDRETSILINMGTGGQISSFVPNLVQTEVLECRPLVDDGYLLAGSSLCGGRAYALLEALFREVAEAVTGTSVKSAYPAMDRMLQAHRNTEDPLIVNTLFSGTRTDPAQRGSIRNISAGNLTMETLCRGFLWGMAEELYGLFQEMKADLREEKRTLIGSGNGIRHNPALRRVLETMFGLPMQIPVQEEAMFGASLYSLVAAGLYKNARDAAALIQYHESQS